MSQPMFMLLLKASGKTVLMVVVSGLIGHLLGLPRGICLFITSLAAGTVRSPIMKPDDVKLAVWDFDGTLGCPDDHCRGAIHDLPTAVAPEFAVVPGQLPG